MLLCIGAEGKHRLRFMMDLAFRDVPYRCSHKGRTRGARRRRPWGEFSPIDGRACFPKRGTKVGPWLDLLMTSGEPLEILYLDVQASQLSFLPEVIGPQWPVHKEAKYLKTLSLCIHAAAANFAANAACGCRS